MIEFRSVVDAVRCAIEVQTGMAERNAGLPPERRIEFRVGIHLGDVVEETDGDLMGDGVNIAARLEGDRCARRDLFIGGRLPAGKGRLELTVRTSARPSSRTSPSRSGYIRLKSAKRARAKSAPAPALENPPAPPPLDRRFAVRQYRRRPEQEHFVDGVTESLTTDLSRIRGLVRDRAQYRLHLQGQAGRSEADRAAS